MFVVWKVHDVFPVTFSVSLVRGDPQMWNFVEKLWRRRVDGTVFACRLLRNFLLPCCICLGFGLSVTWWTRTKFFLLANCLVRGGVVELEAKRMKSTGEWCCSVVKWPSIAGSSLAQFSRYRIHMARYASVTEHALISVSPISMYWCAGNIYVVGGVVRL